MKQRVEKIEYDIRGQICPSSLLIALRALNEKGELLREGNAVLRFFTDNRECLVTIPESARNMGYEVEVNRTGADYLIEIRQGD